MKKKLKKLKGFTLVELIVVMAVLVSILTSILQLMEPVKEAYRDSTIYEQQRTVENSIISYIAESTRYAKAISIIDEGVSIDTDGDGSGDTNPNNLNAAVNYFINKNGLKTADYKDIEIIVIDRKTKFQYKGKDVQGRLVRMRGVTGTVPSWGATVTEAELKGTNWTTKKCYMAMGPDYYGDMSYEILLPSDWSDTLTPAQTDSNGKYFPVNQLQRGFDIVVSPKTAKKGVDTLTKGSVTCMNYFVTAATIDYQTYITTNNSEKSLMPDKFNMKRKGALAGKSEAGNETKDTYIIFLRPDV